MSQKIRCLSAIVSKRQCTKCKELLHSRLGAVLINPCALYFHPREASYNSFWDLKVNFLGLTRESAVLSRTLSSFLLPPVFNPKQQSCDTLKCSTLLRRQISNCGERWIPPPPPFGAGGLGGWGTLHWGAASAGQDEHERRACAKMKNELKEHEAHQEVCGIWGRGAPRNGVRWVSKNRNNNE